MKHKRNEYGNGAASLGCLIMLLPVLAILVIFMGATLWAAVEWLFSGIFSLLSGVLGGLFWVLRGGS